MYKNHDLVKTDLLNLKVVDEKKYLFSIPSYQRPYVWATEDVLKLFDDVINAASRNKKDTYFIGTVLTAGFSADKPDYDAIKGEEASVVFELIDGQQRTTTLMLIALAFRAAGSSHAITKLPSLGKSPRLQFAVREQVQNLLGSWAGLDEYQRPSFESIRLDPYLNKIDDALRVLVQAVDNLDDSEVGRAENNVGITRDEAAEYFYSEVQWVNNEMPAGTDLNRLFATMNTAGVQLEQTDILKARLFEKINSDKTRYNNMWLACEHLENYFERNVRQLFNGTDWQHIDPEQLAIFDEKIFKLEVENDSSHKFNSAGKSIAHLISELNVVDAPASTEQESIIEIELDQETVYCRSIISFPQLLIHAYRVHRSDQKNTDDIEPKLHSDRLLEIFDPLSKSTEDEIKEFIDLLWKARYQFDRWVVKWIERDDSNEESLGLSVAQKPSKSGEKYYINRTQSGVSDLVQLQAVRYFTGDRSAQYWITPFLAMLTNNVKSSSDAVVKILEKIDNELSLAVATQKETSFSQAQCGSLDLNSWQQQKSYFSSERGTGFGHYWFQKLEYLLWKQQMAAGNSAGDSRLNLFRIKSKNSVEHVHPQNEEYGGKVSDSEKDWLNSFGNLVLLSPGENSSYSNQAVEKKEIDFDKKPEYDSLKLKRIFEIKGGRSWDRELIDQHQVEMVDLLESHYLAEPS